MRKLKDEVQDGIKKYTELGEAYKYIESIKQLASSNINAAIEELLLKIHIFLESLQQHKRSLTDQEQTEIAIATLKRIIALDRCVLGAIPKYPDNCHAIQQIHQAVFRSIRPLLQSTHQQLFADTLRTIDAYAIGHRSPQHPAYYRAVKMTLREIHIDHRSKKHAKITQISASDVSNTITLIDLRLLNQALAAYLELKGINQRRQLTAKSLQVIINTYVELKKSKCLTDDDANTLLRLIYASNKELKNRTSWLDRLRGNRLGKLLNRHLANLPKPLPGSLKLSLDAAEILSHHMEKAELHASQRSSRHIPAILRATDHLSKTKQDSRNTIADKQNERHIRIRKHAIDLLKTIHTRHENKAIQELIERIPLQQLEADLNLFARQHKMAALDNNLHDELLKNLICQQALADIFRELSLDNESSIVLRFNDYQRQLSILTRNFLDKLPAHDSEDSTHSGEAGWSQRHVCSAIFSTFGYEPLNLHYLNHLKNHYKKALNQLTEEESGEHLLHEMQRIYAMLKPDRREDSQSESEQMKKAILKQLANLPSVLEKLTQGVVSLLKRFSRNLDGSELSMSAFKACQKKINALRKLVKACDLRGLNDDWDQVIQASVPHYHRALSIHKNLNALEESITSNSPLNLSTVELFIRKQQNYSNACEKFKTEVRNLLSEHPKDNPLHQLLQEKVSSITRGFVLGSQIADWVEACQLLKIQLESSPIRRDDLTQLSNKCGELARSIDEIKSKNEAYKVKIDAYKKALLVPLQQKSNALSAEATARNQHNKENTPPIHLHGLFLKAGSEPAEPGFQPEVTVNA